MQKPSPPKTKTIVLERADRLCGVTLGDIALALDLPMPSTTQRTKGFVGQLLEIALGADAQNLPQPDFQALGIELKTLPLDHKNTPKESTFICSVPNKLSTLQTQWETSWIYKKLQHVLWIPVEATPQIPLANRKIKKPFLWSLNSDPTLANVLKQDFEELIEILILEAETLTAHFGTFLQIRPKAAHSRIMCEKINLEGVLTQTVPKGFYLRTRFTKQLLQKHL